MALLEFETWRRCLAGSTKLTSGESDPESPAETRCSVDDSFAESEKVDQLVFLGSWAKHLLALEPAKLSPPKRMGFHKVCGLFVIAVVGWVGSNIFAETVGVCTLPSQWARVNRCEAGLPHPWLKTRSGPPVHPPRHKIAVGVVLDNFMSPDMRQRTIDNKRSYAEFWGYGMVAPSVEEVTEHAKGYPTAWAKLSVVRKALFVDGYEYIFIVDGDAVIMRNDVDLSLAIDEMNANGASLLISKDFNGLNSGVFVFKRSEWTRKFLDEAEMAQPMLVRKTVTIPLKYENRAFFYLTGMWPDCGGVRRPDTWLVPHYANSTYFFEGTLVVDRCLINRHPVRAESWYQLMDSGAGFDSQENSFIMHCPGGSPGSKTAAMEKLLVDSQSESGASARKRAL